MHIFKLKISELFLLLAGLGMLVALPFLVFDIGLWFWLLAKGSYFIGVTLFIIKK